MYGQGHIWLPSLVTIAAAIWFVLGNSIKKKKKKKDTPLSSTPIVNNTTASTSASAADLVGEYEVFLSFRGADTRNSFTDYLYNDLVGAGVCTFRDDNELRVGEEIGPELLKAIKQSKISIPIFSKNYASSKWCLREFAQMVECKANGGQMIYPIFYDVEPSEVQHYERGSYKAAFLKHDKDNKLDEKTVQQWKAALEIVGDLKGLELKKVTNWREGELVKIVVEEVLSKLKKNYQLVPKNLVGMDSHIEEMEDLLNIDSNGVRIVGILGMGGLGKTTIAKVIYNQICELFECHCFLEDVRENSSSTAIVKLQNQLVSKILKRESKIDDVNQGIYKIKGAIHRKKVLVVLDDVDRKFQIDKLVGNHSWYEAGSRIIITTRNEEVLLALEMTCQNEGLHELYRCYRPKSLDDNPALQLFSKYAFMRDSPSEGYNALAMEVVSSAGGLPLVLVTLGSLLFIEKDKVSWHEKLKKLKAMPPLEVLGRLRISYDALDNTQKQIFLDIACLFSGRDKTKPCYMWDDCKFYPWEGINALVRRSLITIGDDNKLWMHDQLRELGMQIICEENWDEPGEWSRLWRFEDASNIIKMHLGTKNVKVLCLDSSECEQDDDFDILVGQDFSKLLNLRYLRMDFIDLDGDFKNLLQNLRWLEWWCSGNCAPTNLNLENLLVLDLSLSKITDDWGGWSQIMMSNKLKVLILSQCKYFSRAPHLFAFPNLKRLELVFCRSLCRLDGLEQLESLEYLNASYCGTLESLPDLSKLTKLQTLNIGYCKKLTAIQGLDKLESLEILDMSSCYALERLPNLSNLEKLIGFESSWCCKLVEIQGLDKLASLEHLNISGCESLKTLPDLSHLKKLRKLKSDKLKLTEVQGLGGLESLEHLNMNDQEHIVRLSDLSKLRWLRNLEISSCLKLIEIQGLDGLESLELLDMSRCRSIKSILGLSNLKRLKKINISWCDKLAEIQDLDGLESLEILDMSFCLSLERLPDLSNLRKLKHLNINSCYMLVEIQGLDSLESLEQLDMGRCKSIEILPDLPNFGILKVIDLSGCTKLQDVETLRIVESLESLNMSFCKALENMPDLTILKKLKKLEIWYLEELTQLQGLEELKSLESLDISWCKSIENLPDFSNFTNLKELNVNYCMKLSAIRGLEELKFLKELGVVGCESLESIPDLPNTTIQRNWLHG